MIHNNEVISIEEDLLNSRLMLRQFTFYNRNNSLRIQISTLGASVVSVQFSAHEIIANCTTNWEQTSNGRTNWVSHVRGLDTLSLTTGNGSTQTQSIVYQMTPDNRLIVIGKFKTQTQSISPYFFNLNSVLNKGTLEGHLLHIRSSDSSALIRQQLNTTTGRADDTEDVNFASDSPRAIPVNMSSELDAIYSLNSSTDACIIATLQYERRFVEVILQNMHYSPQQQPQQTSNAVSCRLRVRVTNDGICMMPTMMNEFKCIYKFIY